MKINIGIVVPVFNEQSRLDFSYFSKLGELSTVKFIFVDDGSTDGTESMIREFVNGTSNFSFIRLNENVGKANAIRAGWIHLNEIFDFSVLGFLDADGAFAAKDVAHLIALSSSTFEADHPQTPTLSTPLINAFWSSRINLSGRTIVRSSRRYLLGRIFASLIKVFFKGLPWDTQSGFKLFQNDSNFRSCFRLPFTSRWLFDIELLLRLRNSRSSQYIVWEEPVSKWHDVPGSKLTFSQYFTITSDLLKLIGTYRLRKVKNG
jgi:dolichyl-phosphate beta-glucosyltransferase